MAINDPTSSEEFRDKTDQSLGDERDKTDEYLVAKLQTIEAQTSDTIRQLRLEADTARTQQRAAADGRKEDDLALLGKASSPLDEQAVVRERDQADQTQKAERVNEDRARARERVQKRLIAEAVCEQERHETDGHLLNERDHVDLGCAVVDGAPRLVLLDVGRRGAERKPHDRADPHPCATQLRGGHRHPAGVHADGREPELGRLATELLDLRACRIGLQQRVVDEAGDPAGRAAGRVHSDS